ncbi:MAG: OmpA family protein [Bacteroidales bacterium]
MKHSVVVFIVMMFSVQLFAQEELYEMIENNELEKAHTKAKIGIDKRSTYALYYHVLGKVYADTDFAQYDLMEAYHYFDRALHFYERTGSFDRRRYDNIPLNEEIIVADLERVAENILQLGVAEDSIPYLNAFIDTYEKASKETQQKVIYVRDSLAFVRAKLDGTVDSFNEFLETYTESDFTDTAIASRNKIAYDEAIKEKTKKAYKHFLDTYPEAEQVEEIQFAYDALFFDEMTKDGSYKSYVKYLKKYPKSPVAKYAIRGMIDIAKDQKDLGLLKRTVAYSKNINYNYALYEYYKELTSDGEYATLVKFIHEYGNIPFVEVVQRDMDIAEIGENLEMHKGYIAEREGDYMNYIRMAAPKDKAFVALQRLISNDIRNHDWDRALATVADMQKNFGKSHSQVNNLMSMLASEYDKAIEVKEIPGHVNTRKGGEYSPVLTLDSKTMFFCGKKREDNIGGEDIFKTTYDTELGEWGKPTLIEKLSTSHSNDAPVSITSDGTKMIFFKEGVISYAIKDKDGWGAGVEMPGKINETQWSADAMISSDGNTLIFASIRPQNYNYFTDPSYVVPYYHGAFLHQSDIYFAPRTKDGWGEPINAGPVINTIYTDRSPFLHPDMKTLYFSSDGHGGMGGMDVFMSKRLADTCWDCWSKPVNLGKEINDQEDNWGYRITTDGEFAYFAARKPDVPDHDIFYVQLPDDVRPQKVTTIEGKLVNKDGVPIGATIIWEDLETGNEIGQSQSNPETGEYVMALPHGKVYGYYVYDDKYYPLSHNIDLTKKKKPKKIKQEMTAVSYNEMHDQGKAVQLNNLFFNTNESTILPHSIPELKRAAQIIKKYNKKVEISGHTDNVGSAEFNVGLSLRRAQSVRDFLVEEGCDSSLFVIEGYGLRKPIATNETVEGRAKNRRVELRFL